MRSVLVPAARVVRWFENFGNRHGDFRLDVVEGALVATADDGERAVARLPWGRAYAGPPEPESFAADIETPIRWGLLLVRRGGFGAAGGTTPTPVARKVGRRHVQGSTKAGGWSQKRYSRRRDNQAREAFEAAAAHAHRILVEEVGPVEALLCGGDRKAVNAVLADPRLGHLAAHRTDRWLAVGDPTATLLDEALADAWSAEITLTQGN